VWIWSWEGLTLKFIFYFEFEYKDMYISFLMLFSVVPILGAENEVVCGDIANRVARCR